uniref:Uncharacterized protein n=1 Tax=Panagrolaimus sp. JU765 TaxID=591449 RepID=A0AC34Q0A1_9BILA
PKLSTKPEPSNLLVNSQEKPEIASTKMGNQPNQAFFFKLTYAIDRRGRIWI